MGTPARWCGHNVHAAATRETAKVRRQEGETHLGFFLTPCYLISTVLSMGQTQPGDLETWGREPVGVHPFCTWRGRAREGHQPDLRAGGSGLPEKL